MKNILYLITQSELGGAQRYIFDLAENLREEFQISVAFGKQGEEKELAKKLNNIGIKNYTIKYLKREISPINDLFTIFEIIKLIKKLKPDIIHLNSSKISILGSLAAKICFMFHVSCFIIYTVHGWVFNEPLPKWKKLFYQYAEKFTAKFKNKIICVNELDYEIAKNELKIPEKKIILIHHGIKPINFLSKEYAREKIFPVMPEGAERPIVSRENSRRINNEILSLRSRMTDSIIIGTIANLYKTKGLEYLIKTTKILSTFNPEYSGQLSTIIIGEGEERKNLENLIAKNNLQNSFFLIGKIENAAELLKAFDIYVCSSVKEGLPYSILEAMQAGLPIVATNVGGIPEMIEDKKNGLLVRPQNPEELAEKIKILIEDENLRNALGARAKINAEKKFGVKGMIEETKKIYKRS